MTELARYSRQVILREVGVNGQHLLRDSTALVVGIGGLGAPVSLYLAGAGIGRLILSDRDHVERSNLQRQIIYRSADLGRSKLDAAVDHLRALNPECEIEARPGPLDDAALLTAVRAADVVLDCTDAFATRQRINRAAWAAGVPLVSASALRWDGQISVFDPRDPGSPCYACLFPPEPAPEETRCALMGVFAPLVGQMGVMQAGEAIRLLAGLTGPGGSASGHRSLTGVLQMVDGRDGSVTRLRVKRQPACPVCGGGHLAAPLSSA